MKCPSIIAVSCLQLLSAAALGQEIDNTASFRTIDAVRYVRLHYENDFFTATDYYYSQGINLEFAHPAFGKFFLDKLLISQGKNRQTGIAFEHNGFTPTSIDSDNILYGDRPYAATLTARIFSISHLDSMHKRITSSLTLGVIGPAAGGRAMQSTIHQWINDSQPLGWQHQIQNDIVINYTAGIEKSILPRSSSILLTGFGKVHLGTLNTKLSTGMIFMVGKINRRIVSVFGSGSNSSRTKLSLYGYWQPQMNIVGYDATLQGGLFNKSSPYTITSSEIARITFQSNAGIVMNIGRVYLEYFNSFLTKEFETGLRHSWGGVRIGVSI